MRNYSRQREAILEVLRGTRTHPTAAWIYESVRGRLPRISLATVYRNLSELAAEGQIQTLTPNDGSVHFDGDASPHCHFFCTGCGRLLDVPASPSQEEILRAGRAEGFWAERYVLTYYGLCGACAAAGHSTE